MPTEFRRAVDGRIAPDLLERRTRRRASAVTIVAAVLPTLPEPVLRLALQRISATSGFAPDDEGDFFDSFRAVWREAEALSSRHDRSDLRAPVGLLRIVSEALDFRPDETLYVPEYIYKMIETLEANKGELVSIQPALREFSAAALHKKYDIPYHPGALKYFKDKGIEAKALQ